MITRLSIFSFLIFVVCSCQPTEKVEKEFKVEYEQIELENGLKVIFHIDRSDPVVAVALTAHVGSAREIEGRTGFAHLFEHLLFLESENLGKGGLDKMSARIGGSGANGSTSRDRTNYFQTVPNDALEKMIWAEADKLGYFINTVSEQVLAKEKQVVKNEKRQSNDNRPYGHTQYVIDKHLYPAAHPYNWQVIGSLEDLQNATLKDVKDFYNRWYVPNNSTLVVAGDFDIAQAKMWVEKYFAEIARGEEILEVEKQPAVLVESKSLYHEDLFARLPELRIAWPGVPQYHPDSYALNVLSTYLTDGKRAPFNQVLVDDKKLTSRVGMFGYNSEIAGQAMISVRGFQDVDLDDIKSALDEAMAKFEAEGISEEDLSRIKAGQETGFYRSLSSVLGKGFQLAQYNIFAGDPGYINEDGKKILGVTTEDVMRVYNQYIKDKPAVMTSFVPKGQLDLALEGSILAEVPNEQIVAGAEEEFDASIAAEYERSPSSFDRTIEPDYGQSPESVIPKVWTDERSNGMTVHGITNSEVPLVQFNIAIKGGLMLEAPDKVGVSNLMAQIMTKGTANKTTEQLEEEIKKLGSSINVQARDQEIIVNASCLSKNFEATFALVQEILLEPRWDEEEFALAMDRVKAQIKNQEANPNSIAGNYFKILTYGEGNILSNNNIGTEESLATIGVDDLKNYYASNISPSVASFHVVGDVDQNAVTQALSYLDDGWKATDVQIPDFAPAAAPEASQVFFYDVPGAKQSVIRFGYPALAATHEDYYPATVANYILGGGGFASQLTQQLREGKGYTYGIRSGFSGNDIGGTFSISSGVRSNVTYESASLVKDILTDYPENYNENDLEVTKGFLIKSNARAFETLGSKLGMLKSMSSYGWAPDYAKQREQIVKDMTVERVQELSRKYMDPNKMFYLVVGDATTQLDRLKDLGFGDPVLINKTEGEL